MGNRQVSIYPLPENPQNRAEQSIVGLILFKTQKISIADAAEKGVQAEESECRRVSIFRRRRAVILRPPSTPFEGFFLVAAISRPHLKGQCYH